MGKRTPVTRHYVVPVRIRVTADDETMLPGLAARGAKGVHIWELGPDWEIVAVDPDNRTAELEDPAPQLALFTEDAA